MDSSDILLTLKSLHIVGVVAWFAGMFYLVRIFVYHREALDMADPKKEILSAQFMIMEQRVYKIICNPGMIISWIAGIGMIYLYGLEWLKQQPWMHVKLLFVLGLSAYHGICKGWMRKLAKGEKIFTSEKFRLLNEVPTVVLFVAVPLAIFKTHTNPLYLVVSTMLLIILLMAFTKLYKRIRERNHQ